MPEQCKGKTSCLSTYCISEDHSAGDTLYKMQIAATPVPSFELAPRVKYSFDSGIAGERGSVA